MGVFESWASFAIFGFFGFIAILISAWTIEYFETKPFYEKNIMPIVKNHVVINTVYIIFLIAFFIWAAKNV